MFCPKWYKAGVISLGDLLDGNGKIMDLKSFTVTFKAIKAIPKDWLIEIEQFVHQSHNTGGPGLHCCNQCFC